MLCSIKGPLGHLWQGGPLFEETGRKIRDTYNPGLCQTAEASSRCYRSIDRTVVGNYQGFIRLFVGTGRLLGNGRKKTRTQRTGPNDTKATRAKRENREREEGKEQDT
jgi:hypothetical protein